jgi:hypothetical protein
MKTAGYGCLNLEITAEFVSGTGPVGDGIAAVVASGVSHRSRVGRERFGKAQIEADVLTYLQPAEIAGQTQ